MSFQKWNLNVLIVSLMLLPAVSFAAEHGGKEMSSTSDAPAAPESAAPEAPPAAPAAVTPVTPEPAPVAPPALKPITITFSGDLSALSATETPPMISVQDRYGVKKEISVPAEAKVTQAGSAKSLSDLKVGDKLTVEYNYDVATGKRTAQSISIGEAAAAPAGK